MKSNIHFCYIFLFTLFIFFNCQGLYKTPPIAEKGILDLRISIIGDKQTENLYAKKIEEWNFKKDGTINLNGEWEFYLREMIQPEIPFVSKPMRINDVSYIRVPGNWNNFKIDDKEVGSDGFATYRLLILTNQKENLSLRLNRIGTAYKLYVNGRLLSEVGKVGSEANNSKPYFYPQVIDIPEMENTQLEILLQVSNFHHRRGGIIEAIQLGDKEQIHSMRESNLTLDVFLVGSLLIMGFYHFGLFILRRKDLSPLYFGMICSVLALNSLMFGERYFYRIFQSFPYNWGVTFEFLTFNLAIPAFILFIAEVFPKEINKRFLQLILIISVILCSIVLFFPPRIFTFIINTSYGTILVVVIYTIYLLFIAIGRKREGAKIFLSGFVVFAIFIINDILFVTNIIQTAQMAPFGFFWFIFSQSFFLSMRFSRAFIQVEELSENLKEKTMQLMEYSLNLEEKVRERTQELNNTLKIIKKDLNIAKKIQINSLLVNPNILNEMNIVPIYIPMAEVGGDFYDISKVNENTYRIFQADATGHGVQAAMITMAIKGIYDNIKFFDLEVSQVMGILNDEYIEKYRSLNTFMTAFLVDIDIKKQELKYVSAGHPAAVLSKATEQIILKERGRLIGISANNEYKHFTKPFNRTDRLFIFTDGVFEEFNKEREEFGEERIYFSLAAYRYLPIETIMENILSELDHFLDGKEKQDDINFLGIEYRDNKTV